jgi:hypothetical protein
MLHLLKVYRRKSRPVLPPFFFDGYLYLPESPTQHLPAGSEPMKFRFFTDRIPRLFFLPYSKIEPGTPAPAFRGKGTGNHVPAEPHPKRQGNCHLAATASATMETVS